MVATSFDWTDGAVRAALGLRFDQAHEALVYAGVSTDSRTVSEGDLFVALSGPHFDGHHFVADAVAAGARGAVVSRAVPASDGAVLYLVDDVLVALGRLARYRRDALPARVVGIGGSAGKTSTKELVAAAVAGSRAVHATRANLNNRIGVPLTLLGAPAASEVVVVEMGTSERGEMAALAQIVRPDVGVLVTVGEEHLAGLGSREGAVEEELDLLRSLGAEGVAVVGDTPDDLPVRARALVPGVRVAGWSTGADHDLSPRDVSVDAEGHYSFTCGSTRVTLRIAGRHAVVNALLAMAVVRAVGADEQAAAEAIGRVEASGMRGEMRRIGDLRVIVDCYNANPQSVVAALDLLASRPAGARKVVVLGSMLELGDRSAALHRAVLADALSRDLDLVLATGAFATAAADLPAAGPRLLVVDDPRAAYALLRERLDGDEVVLLKGSRGVALERLLPMLEVDFGAGETG